eukprot:CAMPEP_0175962896 /NCGR_PEP_ID=MMETSP0108-20121206/36723_1 /TAXON_ID=195067 ORGANISM="Goniomonas pacifica, Strain CCMP1869" /NCGR_SAMPLE_ID=MMETSP0108 /ASSEMBLY_ACC=CAM_ASM_000204 /LENGTH=125 /DNA_ID=CAMNT_0017290743 /DNA_START=10 /DNA_END=385 /DNA_ORIENTATION=-
MSGQPKKVVLIGDFGVGKSTTLMQLCRRRFGAAVTEALDMKQKEFCVQNGRKKITLQIWDTAGLEKTDSLAVNFFRHSAGVVLSSTLRSQSADLIRLRRAGSTRSTTSIHGTIEQLLKQGMCKCC